MVVEEKSIKFEHGYALIVGVGVDLPVTIRDALAVYGILGNKAHCGYKEENLRLLTSEEATKNNILNGLEWLGIKAAQDPDSIIVVYFSGHGSESPFYHLVPYGYDPGSILSTAISGKEFTQMLKGIKSKKQLILLDCCHAGGMVEKKLLNFTKSPIPVEIEEILFAGSGRVVIASSRRDEVSYTGNPYSLFTQALRESLAGYGSSERDGYSYITDIALYTSRWVANRSNDKQHPILKLAGADDFAVAYYAGGDAIPKKIEDSMYFESSLPIQRNDAISLGYKKILQKYKSNLVEVELQMAMFYDQAAIPLDLRRTRNDILEKIVELENMLKQTR